MTAYEVTFRIWADSAEEAHQVIMDRLDDGPICVQESDDQTPPDWWAEVKV